MRVTKMDQKEKKRKLQNSDDDSDDDRQFKRIKTNKLDQYNSSKMYTEEEYQMRRVLDDLHYSVGELLTAQQKQKKLIKQIQADGAGDDLEKLSSQVAANPTPDNNYSWLNSVFGGAVRSFSVPVIMFIIDQISTYKNTGKKVSSVDLQSLNPNVAASVLVDGNALFK